MLNNRINLSSNKIGLLQKEQFVNNFVKNLNTRQDNRILFSIFYVLSRKKYGKCAFLSIQSNYSYFNVLIIRRFQSKSAYPIRIWENTGQKKLQIQILSVCSYHVTYAFQSESTFYSCLNVKELLAQSRRKIWSLSDCNWTRTHNYLNSEHTVKCTVQISTHNTAQSFK